MNLRFHHGISDITGLTGLRIIDAWQVNATRRNWRTSATEGSGHRKKPL
jgi:hypothetical protein